MPPKHLQVVLALAVVCLLPVGPRIAHAHGSPDDKIRALSAKLERDPANVELRIKRADHYRENGMLSFALSDYERALRLDPSRDTLHLALALTLAEQRDFSRALTSVDTFIARDRENARAWRTRAQTLAALGRTADAVESIEHTIALADPPSPDDYLLRAEFLSSLGSLDAAIAGLDEGLHRLGPAVTLQFLAVELERKRGTFDAALVRLDQMERQYERAETVLALRGDVLADAGRGMEADVAYTDALQLIEQYARTTPAARQLRAELLQKLGH